MNRSLLRTLALLAFPLVASSCIFIQVEGELPEDAWCFDVQADSAASHPHGARVEAVDEAR